MACLTGVPPSTRTSIGAPPTPRFGLAKLKLQTPDADKRRGSEMGCLKSELGSERVRRYRASCEEPTFTCGRIRSTVSGLLFTGKIATRTCECVSARYCSRRRSSRYLRVGRHPRAQSPRRGLLERRGPAHGPAHKLMLVPARQIWPHDPLRRPNGWVARDWRRE